jgi:hypothetical protein
MRRSGLDYFCGADLTELTDEPDRSVRPGADSIRVDRSDRCIEKQSNSGTGIDAPIEVGLFLWADLTDFTDQPDRSIRLAPIRSASIGLIGVLKSSPTRPRVSMRRSRLDNSLAPISPIITDEPDRSIAGARRIRSVRMPSAPSASSAFVFRMIDRVIMLLPARDR